MARISIILIGLVCFTSFQTWSQTVFATETFQASAAPKGTLANGYVGDMGIWTAAATGANGISANEWYVSGEECGNAAGICGSACPGGDHSLHLSAIGGLCGTPDCGAAYDETNANNITNKRAISPTIDCTGNFFIELNFNYIAAQGDDQFFVEYSTNNGTTWNTFTGGNVAASSCCSCLDAFFCGFIGICCPPQVPQPCSSGGQGLWTAVNLAFPATADNNPNVKFAFHWSNDGDGAGIDPSVAIDDITLTYATMLNVELVRFEGEAIDNVNKLEWTTISEQNSDYFEIQHSRDGITFQKIGAKDAAYNSGDKNDYLFIHEVEFEKNYYRLKSVDMNGDHSYSEIISLANDLGGIYLSTTDGIRTVKGLENKSGQILIYDLSGKVISSPIYFNLYDHQKTLWLSNLIPGIYIVSVQSSTGNKQFKISL